MNIYDLPCPECGSAIVSTARLQDDTQAPTQCENNHTFMRSVAYDKRRNEVAAFHRNLKNELRAKPLKIEAAFRLQATKLPKGKSSKQERLDNEIRNLQTLIANQKAVLKRATSEEEKSKISKAIKRLESKLSDLRN